MDKKNIKRIIAREGLIIIVFIIFGIILLWVSDIVHDRYYYSEWLVKRIDHTIGGFNWHNDSPLFSNGQLLKYIAIGLYPIYMLIRFILWAIKTLRERCIESK